MKASPSFHAAMAAVVLLLAPTLLRADPDYIKTPLPPGPILATPPDFAKWQILFTYAPASASGNGGSSADSFTPPPAGSLLPKSVTVTRTKPLWEAVLVDGRDQVTTCIFDGFVSFLQSPGNVAAPITDPVHTPLPRMLDLSHRNFLDMDWVSTSTYLGTEKSTSYLVFQEGPAGTMVWIDGSTHLPVRWQRGDQVRTYQFLSAPEQPLQLPEDIAKLSLQWRHIRDVTSHLPIRGG